MLRSLREPGDRLSGTCRVFPRGHKYAVARLGVRAGFGLPCPGGGGQLSGLIFGLADTGLETNDVGSADLFTVGQPNRTVASNKRPCTRSTRAPHSSRVHMRDSNDDSNALSPTVVRQPPLTREHAQNRRCGRLCWLLLISGLGVRFPRGAHCDVSGHR